MTPLPAPERDTCALPDPQIGWWPCARDPGHDGMHEASFTIHRFVPTEHTETYRLCWELIGIDTNPEGPTDA